MCLMSGSSDDAEEQRDDGENEQNVDDAAHTIIKETEQPPNNQYDRYDVQETSHKNVFVTNSLFKKPCQHSFVTTVYLYAWSVNFLNSNPNSFK